MLTLNIVEEIFRRSDLSAPALVAKGTVISYGQLKEQMERAAGLLSLQKGQRVGLLCPNGIHHIVWSLAVLRAGGVLVPVAGELSLPERDALVKTTALETILCAGGKEWHRTEITRCTLELDDMPAVLFTGISSPQADFDEDNLLKLNPALIRFSSGTTGKRKGVVLSHETLLARVKACNEKLGIRAGDRVIWTLPMAHHFAVSIVLYLLHGATTVLEDSHLGEDVYRTLKEQGGTVLYGSPFHYALLGGLADGRPVPSLRLAVSTAAALTPTVADAFYSRYQLPLCQGMGIIEVGLPLLNREAPLEKPESIGTPQPGFEITLLNQDGQQVTKGEVGELHLKGPGIFDAYLSPWTTQEDVLRDGFFATGDLARQDEEGFYYLVGRTHTVINVGGMKCFPEEIEAVLAQHPSVQEARVIGIPHPTFGSVPAAEIIPVDMASPPRSSELMSLCRRELSSYKIPLRYTMVSELPKTPSGKLQR